MHTVDRISIIALGVLGTLLIGFCAHWDGWGLPFTAPPEAQHSLQKQVDRVPVSRPTPSQVVAEMARFLEGAKLPSTSSAAETHDEELRWELYRQHRGFSRSSGDSIFAESGTQAGQMISRLLVVSREGSLSVHHDMAFASEARDWLAAHPQEVFEEAPRWLDKLHESEAEQRSFLWGVLLRHGPASNPELYTQLVVEELKTSTPAFPAEQLCLSLKGTMLPADTKEALLSQGCNPNVFTGSRAPAEEN